MSRNSDGFLPIEDYGVIGNLHTVALVSKCDASIDYCCYPRFDSPTIFGRLLTSKGGGFWDITPSTCSTHHFTPKQLYLPSSNVLVTRYLGAGVGVGQVTDFLPVMTMVQEDADTTYSNLVEELLRKSATSGISQSGALPSNTKMEGWPWIVRKVETIRGRIRYRMKCQPAFNYGRESHQVNMIDSKIIFQSATQYLALETFPSNETNSEGSTVTWSIEKHDINYGNMDEDRPNLTISLPLIYSEFELDEHEALYFVLRPIVDTRSASYSCLQQLLHLTNSYWHNWIAKCTYKGRWREMVHRSALVLKLLTYAPTGAIIAAPTFSLPEEINGNKNWDYRFTWIRDAAFTIYAFLRIGLTEEAAQFMGWIEKRCQDIADDPMGLRLMYDVRGRHPTIQTHNVTSDGRASVSALATETILNHWTGYKDSRPVRIGNLAALQEQLDIYGELMDAIYLCDKWVKPISFDFWLIIRDILIPTVIRGWQEPDHGIWETRQQPQHHVYSKVMAWVALDRAIRLAIKRSLPAPLPKWVEIRDAIYESVMSKGYNQGLGVFTQFYGSENLDASNLIMPLVFFLPPDDPRFLRTLEKTLLPPSRGGLTVNHLVFRYHPGQTGVDPEGTFSICSFWLVEALARAGRRQPRLLEEAVLMFEDIIGYANHLGLFSEEIGLDGEALGNFPQAFTHLSLISAAFNLDRALGE